MEAPCFKVLPRQEIEPPLLCSYSMGLYPLYPLYQDAVALLLQHGYLYSFKQCKGIKLINLLYRADPTATTANNPNLPERWAYNNNHVGVLAELVKVKEVALDIMDSSLGKLVLKEEEREWRRKMLEMITLLARRTLGTEHEQENVNVANISNPFV